MVSGNQHKLTDSEYLDRLKNQRDFLLSDVSQYEEGKHHFGAKLAATLRTIFHNTARSKAILPDLAQRYGYNLRFKSRRLGLDLADTTTLYIGFKVGERILREDDFEAPFFVETDFETYWNAVVYKEGPTIYTRKQVILFYANKYGGAHVDPEIPQEFLILTDRSGTKIKSKRYDDELIGGRITYEMAIHTILLLERLIPFLEKRINP